MGIITKQMVTSLRADIDKALAEVGKKYGVTLNAGNATYSDLEATFKLQVRVAATADFDPEKEIWNRYCKTVNLPEDYYGRTFTSQGATYKICGFKPGARTNCIKIQDVATGKDYVCAPMMVHVALPMDAPAKRERQMDPPQANSHLMNFEEWKGAILFSGLQESDLGKQICIHNIAYIITGFNSKARTNKVLIQRTTDKKQFATTVEAALFALGRDTSKM